MQPVGINHGKVTYIDTYTIEQAVADGATVPIFYESKLPELRIVGSNLDALFDRVFADRTKEEREAIKKRYATEQAIARVSMGTRITGHPTKPCFVGTPRGCDEQH